MAQWYTVSIAKQGGTCDYSTLYYYQYSSSTVSSLDGWYASQSTSSGNRVYSLGQSKTACAFLGGFANANGTGTQYVPSDGSLSNIAPSSLPSSSTFSVYLCWSGPSAATLSKTNLSGGPPYIFYDSATGNLYDDASMTTPLPTATVQEGGQTVAAWGPIIIPAKECYSFGGFYSGTNNTGTLYIDENGYVRQSLVDALAAMTANDSLTIYAQGTEVSKKLTLNANGGTGGWSAIYNSLADRSKWYADSLCEGDPITSVPIPGKITSANAGYVFNGYKYSSTVYIDDAGALTSALTSLTNFTNRTATAQWQSTTKMTVSANGGTGGDAFFYWCSSRSAYFHAVDGVLTETTAIVPPSRPGYAFTGLYTAATGGTQKVSADGTIASGLTSATTLYAQWMKTAYTVTFSGAPDTLPTLYVKASGGGLYRDADCEEAVESGELLWESPPVKDGYTFLGVFAADSSSSTQYATSTGAATADFVSLTATGDVTVYCVFDVLQEVSFDDAGGTGGPASLWYLDHQLYSDSIGETAATWPISPLPSRECFAFLGYFDGTGDTQYIDSTGAMTQAFSDLVTAGMTEPLDLYAQWDRRTWRVTLDAYGAAYSLAGGEVGWTSDPEGTTAITSVPVPVRAGYEFLGYFTSGGVQVVNSAGAVMEFVGGDGDVSLVARWNANQYTLNFVGSATASKEVTFGAAIGTLPAISITPPTGARFSSWSIDGLPISATTPWTWPEDKTASILWEYAFGDVTDYFGLASETLIPFESSDGSNNPRVVTRHYGKAQGADQTGPKWLNPTVKYMVVGDMTLAVTLGKAFAKKTGTIYGPYYNGSAWVFGNHTGMTETGYMITSVTVETALDSFPVVTVSATANEGANAINQFSVSVPILARARAQNLLSAVSGGGELHALSLMATCDPVVLQEGLAPCASDAVNGRIEVHAETVPLDFEIAPAAGTGFTQIGLPVSKSGTDFTRFSISLTKEVF